MEKMEPLAVLAEAFSYPSPGALERLEAQTFALPSGPVKTALRAFLDSVEALSPGEWEELYTRTWDLNPLTPPYIGFQIWGEDYKRGNFLARLQAAYRTHEIEMGGELADHLVPILRYLASDPQPCAELLEVFPQAIEKMTAALRKREAGNPYLYLLGALNALELSNAGLR